MIERELLRIKLITKNVFESPMQHIRESFRKKKWFTKNIFDSPTQTFRMKRFTIRQLHKATYEKKLLLSSSKSVDKLTLKRVM